MSDVGNTYEIFNSVNKFDGDNKEKNYNFAKFILVVISCNSKRKRQKFNFSRMYVHDWQSGDTSKKHNKQTQMHVV